MNTTINFTDTLKLFRATKNLTQSEMSTKLSICQPTYSKIENGQRLPDTLMIFKVSEILEIDLFYLFHLLFPNQISIDFKFQTNNQTHPYTILMHYVNKLTEKDISFLATYATFLFSVKVSKSQ